MKTTKYSLENIFYLALLTCLVSSCTKNPSSTSNVTITGINPTHGGSNTSVTITGSGFNSTSAQNNVFFNSKKANIAYASSTELRATVPALPGTGPVTVTVNGNTATGPVFSYDTSYTVNTFAMGFHYPQYLVEDKAGNLYVTNFGDATLSKVSKAGVVSTFATGLNGVTGITIDASGNLFAATNDNTNVSKIVKIDASGTKTSFANITGYVYGLSIDKDGNIYAANALYGTICKITTSGTVTTFANSLGGAVDVAVSASGNIYAVGTANGTVYKVTSAGEVSILYRFTSGTAGLTVDGNENLFVTVNNSVFQLNSGGTKNIAPTGFDLPRGIIISSEGDFFVVNTSNDTISKISVQ
jgi:hypothetical protein